MPNQYFDPYYAQWDDGTYGQVNIGDAEAAATERARRFYTQSQGQPTAPFFEPPESEHRKRVDAWLKRAEAKYGPGPEGPLPQKERGPLADRPFGDSDSWNRKTLPDLLQPTIQEKRVKWQLGYYGFQDSKLQSLLGEFHGSPDWRQAELQGPYDDLKGKVDATRSDLNKQKQNLINASRLEARDAQMLKLAEEDPVFKADSKTVRRIYADFETGMRPVAMLDAKIDITKTMLGFLELRDAAQKLTGELNPDLTEYKAEHARTRQQLADLLEEKQKIVKAVEAKTVGSKEYRSAHVNASDTLTKKGLNIKGFPLAGRLLAATPYDEIKSVINAARTGGIVDEDGNFPSPEDIRETEVDAKYIDTLRYLTRSPEQENAEKTAQQNAQKEREANLARQDKEILAAKKEDKVKTKLEINNEKLKRAGIYF